MFDRRMDYLDLQGQRQREGFYKIKEKDEDGIEYESTIVTYCGLGFALFQMLGMAPVIKSRHKGCEYSSPERDIFWEAYDLNFSLQLKGGFFLRHDYKDLLPKILNFLRERNIIVSTTRADLSFTVIFPGDFFKEVGKGDFKNLLVKPTIHKKKTTYFKSSNSRFDVVAYSKTNQLKKEKFASYKDKFLKSHGLETVPDDLYRIDLRVHYSKTNEAFTELLHKEKINFDALEAEVLKQASKRMRFSKKIRDSLKI